MASLLAIDLSSIAHPLWHGLGQRDPDHLTDAILGRVRTLAAGFDLLAVCCDCPGKPTWRTHLFEGYKAGHGEWPEALIAHYRTAFARLRADCATYAVPGNEADDLLATVTTWARNDDRRHEVTIASSDKDLSQLVGAHVRVLSPLTAKVVDSAEVQAKWGVAPEQMGDLLALAGDASDCIKGLDGIGPKRAANLLTRFGTADLALRTATCVSGAKAMRVSESVYRALVDGRPVFELARTLVGLRSDVPIDFSLITRRANPWR